MQFLTALWGDLIKSLSSADKKVFELYDELDASVESFQSKLNNTQNRETFKDELHQARERIDQIRSDLIRAQLLIEDIEKRL